MSVRAREREREREARGTNLVGQQFGRRSEFCNDSSIHDDDLVTIDDGVQSMSNYEELQGARVGCQRRQSERDRGGGRRTVDSANCCLMMA